MCSQSFFSDITFATIANLVLAIIAIASLIYSVWKEKFDDFLNPMKIDIVIVPAPELKEVKPGSDVSTLCFHLKVINHNLSRNIRNAQLLVVDCYYPDSKQRFVDFIPRALRNAPRNENIYKTIYREAFFEFFGEKEIPYRNSVRKESSVQWGLRLQDNLYNRSFEINSDRKKIVIGVALHAENYIQHKPYYIEITWDGHEIDSRDPSSVIKHMVLKDFIYEGYQSNENKPSAVTHSFAKTFVRLC